MLTCRTAFMTASATCALIAALASAGPAGAADLPTRKAPAPMLLDTSWYTEGNVEVGGRFFVNNPQNGAMPGLGHSLAKYYEYSDLRPGPFANLFLATGTRDGLRRYEIYGKNIGYADQRYGLYADQLGLYYFNFMFDQTPHVYGYGYTPFYGVGSNYLWIPGAVRDALVANPNGNARWNVLNLASNPIDVKIQRTTEAADARWTPNDAWDVRANFSNMDRKGVQADGVTYTWGTNNATQNPKPVNDNTKNYGLNAEYAGTSPWDKNYTFKVAYNGSTYTDNYKGYLSQNPLCTTAGVCTNGAPFAMMSLPPSNSSNGVSSTLALDLPLKSRYVGTFSFTNSQQNDPFLPFTLNQNPALTFAANGLQASNPLALPARSLNGNVNTYLSNNVLTTNITTDLKSKLSYRYYNYENRTPSIFFPYYVGADNVIVQGIPANPLVLAATNTYAQTRSTNVSYIKQNGGAELNWHPIRTLNLGAAYGYERYDWKRESATSTDENSGKIWADWKPATWIDAKLSGLFARRTVNNYDYLTNLGLYQWGVATTNTLASPGNTRLMANQRVFYLTGRERAKVDFQLGVDVLENLRVTPSFQYENNYYPLANGAMFYNSTAMYAPSLWQMGLNWSRSSKAGIEASYAFNPTTRFYGFYTYERLSQGLQIGVPGRQVSSSATQQNEMQKMSVTDHFHTFKVGMDTTLFDRLDFKTSYTFARGTDQQPLGPTSLAFMNYQPMITVFNRFDAGAKYRFEKSWVRSMGLDGEMAASLDFAWERNSVTNWQQALNYMYSNALTGAANLFFMGYVNPNYNVQRLTASVSYKW